MKNHLGPDQVEMWAAIANRQWWFGSRMCHWDLEQDEAGGEDDGEGVDEAADGEAAVEVGPEAAVEAAAVLSDWQVRPVGWEECIRRRHRLHCFRLRGRLGHGPHSFCVRGGCGSCCFRKVGWGSS
jgi:hypothetical protein